MLLPAQPLMEPEQEEQDVPLLSALLQLKQLQQINSWNCPLPLVILVPWPHSDADAQKLEEGDWKRNPTSPLSNHLFICPINQPKYHLSSHPHLEKIKIHWKKVIFFS